MSTIPPEMKLIYEKMKYLGQKQKVATDNLSRASIPGEGEKTIAPFKAMLSPTKVSAGSVSVTHSGHISVTSKGSHGGFKVKENFKNNEVNLAGNAISSENALMELNDAGTETYRYENAHKNIAGRMKTIYSIGSK